MCKLLSVRFMRLYTMNEHPEIAIIPLGGSGSRLLPLTHGVQKELLPLGRYSLLHWAMKEAVQAGIDKFILLLPSKSTLWPFALGTESDKVLSSLRDSSLRFSDQYRGILEATEEWFTILRRVVAFVSRPTGLPPGLAAAIVSAEELVRGRPFAVMLPDDFIAQPSGGLPAVVEAWSRRKGWALSVVEIQSNQFQEFGVVEARPRPDASLEICGASEKPVPKTETSGLGIVGRYIFDHDFFDVIRETQERVMAEESQSGFHITEAIHQVALAGNATGVMVKGPYFHVGTVQGYLEAWKYLCSVCTETRL
jgi:UTP--glucose-1-phosphate uridylyltransferase